MFVYLDEAGDTGFKFNRGSSRYFVVVLLMVNDPEPVRKAVDRLRSDLKRYPEYEFKFYHCGDEIRLPFLQMIRRQDVVIRTMVIDKHLMTRPHMRRRDIFYNYLVQMILKHDDATIRDATLILDESAKSKKSKQDLTSYLRRSLNTNPAAPKIRQIRYHDSRADSMIQAIDMIVGAIYANYHRGRGEYLGIIRPRIGDLWEWAPRTQ